MFEEKTHKKLWFDREQAVDSKVFKEFLVKLKLKLNHTFREVKVSVAKRIIRTLKDKYECIKTEYRRLDKKFTLVDIYLKLQQAYNYETKRSAHRMTPAESSKKTK